MKISKIKFLWIIVSMLLVLVTYKVKLAADDVIKKGINVTANVVSKNCMRNRKNWIDVSYMERKYRVIVKGKLCHRTELNDEIKLKYVRNRDKLFFENHNPYVLYFRLSIASFIVSLIPFKEIRNKIYVYG